MSPEEWGLGIALVSLLVGLGALGYARRAAKVSEEELELTREQATLRPKLAVSLREMLYQSRPPTAEWPHDKLALVFEVTNSGRSAANNIRNNIRLDERHFVPDETHLGTKPEIRIRHLGPSESTVHQINVHVLHYGSTQARYTCVCDEVGATEDTIEFEVHERRQ